MVETEALSAAERNRLLRRVDWRFLLAVEGLPATVCFAGRRLTQALELVSASVSRAGGHASPADLAVLVSPRRRALDAAYGALRPGGEVYSEWYLPPVGPTRVRRRLEEAGFVNVRCYTSWPWPQRTPMFWLPLDAPETVSSYLASRPYDGRHRTAVLRRAWNAAVRLQLMMPICAIAEKPKGHSGDDQEQASDDALPTDVSWVLLTGGRRSVNKVVGLGFEDAQPVPRLAVKFARNASEDLPLQREASTLRMLEAAGVEFAGAPEVLFVGRRSGRVAVGETFVAGRPILDRLDGESFAAVAARLTDWLVDLARAPRKRSHATWTQRLVENPVREFERMFASVVDTEETARARQIISTLIDPPLVCEHRDCSPWNVLQDDDGNLALVDWESSEPDGLPGLDLVYFLSYAALFVERTLDTGQAAETYARTLDPTTALGSVVRACEESYSTRIGLDPEQLRPLRLLCWIVHSRSEYRQLEQDALGPPTQSALAGSLFLSLWREELKRPPLTPVDPT